MLAPRYMIKASIYAGLLPAISARSPKTVGASPWKIIYEVRVRLISPLETLRSCWRGNKAGKYIFAEVGDMNEAKVTIVTMYRFFQTPNAEYTGPVETVASCSRSWASLRASSSLSKGFRRPLFVLFGTELHDSDFSETPPCVLEMFFTSFVRLCCAMNRIGTIHGDVYRTIEDKNHGRT